LKRNGIFVELLELLSLEFLELLYDIGIVKICLDQSLGRIRILFDFGEIAQKYHRQGNNHRQNRKGDHQGKTSATGYRDVICGFIHLKALFK